MLSSLICFDRICREDDFFSNSAQRLAVLKAKKFPNASQLSIQFSTRTGTTAQRRKFMATAEEFMEHANLDLREASPGRTGELRVSFDRSLGSWSYLGTDCLRQPLNSATTNLAFGHEDGGPNAGTYMHELMHGVAAAVHEHQSPEAGIQWDREEVIRRMSGPPNNWDQPTIERNVFERYSEDQTNATNFDPDSIMLYFFPRSFLVRPWDGWKDRPNTKLSDQDIAWLRSQYPGRGGDPPDDRSRHLPVIDLGDGVVDAISRPGEVDLYDFQMFDYDRQRVRVETLGETSVVLRLFGPDSKTRLVAESNNVGVASGAVIEQTLDDGVYYVQVSHVEPSGVGEYMVRCVLPAEHDPLGCEAGKLTIKAVCPIVPGTYNLDQRTSQ